MTSRRSVLLPIFLIVAVDILGFTLVLPLLPFYAERFGASAQTVGLIVTSYAFCQLFAGPVLGRISDVTGRKSMLIVSQIGTCIGFIVLANAQMLWVVFLARIIDGITAGNLPIAQAYIADVTEPKDRAKAFGIIGIAFGLGFLIGPALSGFLAGYGYNYPIWAAAFLSFTSIICTAFLLPNADKLETLGIAKAVRPEGASVAANPAAGSSPGRKKVLDLELMTRYFRVPGLGSLLLQFLMFGMAFTAFTSGFALFAERRLQIHGVPYGPREVGFVYTYFGFLGLIVQGFLLGRLVKKYGESRIVLIGFLSMGIGYAALSGAHVLPYLLIIGTFGSFGSGVLRPALTSLITQKVGRHEQGAALGVSQSLTSIAAVIAPAMSGFLIERHWLSGWACACGGFGFLGLFFAMRSRKVNATTKTAHGPGAPNTQII